MIIVAHLRERCCDVSSVSESLTLDGRVQVEQYISELTNKRNVLRF